MLYAYEWDKNDNKFQIEVTENGLVVKVEEGFTISSKEEMVKIVKFLIDAQQTFLK